MPEPRPADAEQVWEVRQSEATGYWYVNTGREIWKCFDEERARLIASAPSLQAALRARDERITALRELLDWIDTVCEGTPKQPFLEITQRIRGTLVALDAGAPAQPDPRDERIKALEVEAAQLRAEMAQMDYDHGVRLRLEGEPS